VESISLFGWVVQKLGILPLGKLFHKLSNEKNINKHLESIFGFETKKITNGLAALSLACALLIGIILRKLGQPLIVVILIFITLFLFIIKTIDHLLFNSFEIHQIRKSVSAVLLLNNVWAVWGVTGSIFDLIQYIVHGNYIEDGENWRTILNNVNMGMNPEKSIRDFLKASQYYELDHIFSNLLYETTPGEMISLHRIAQERAS